MSRVCLNPSTIRKRTIKSETAGHEGAITVVLQRMKIERYLRSMSMEGTCNWAQPGRIKRFLKFVKQEEPVTPELSLFAT
ncbi:MAG: hypothetical protein HY674_02435 [Chloroflexi bacterium]|nr:hypothetical protein [Chloroflexota bacterium]